MNPTDRDIFLTRREAKWQFRRMLLLEVARILNEQPDQVWPQITRSLAMLVGSPSEATRRNTRRWLRFAGNTPEKTVATIHKYFTEDTPESPRRHKLQDLSDGHPFGGVIPDETGPKLRKQASQAGMNFLKNLRPV